MEIRELIEKMKTATEEQNEELMDVADDMLNAVKRNFPTTYKKYETKVSQILAHEGLTEEEAREAVSHLVNEDGTRGPHWDESSIRKVVEMYPELAQYGFWCVYYVMNMIYSDYYDSSFTVKTYAKLAKDFIGDKDAPADKVRRYIEAMKK